MALITVIFGAITSNAMNDYSGSLALQAAGVKTEAQLERRSRNRAGIRSDSVDPSGQHGSQVPKCVALQRILDRSILGDHPHRLARSRGIPTPARLSALMDLKKLGRGWPALVSLVVGFGAMVPFMNTAVLVGPVARALDGADLSFYVGFLVAGAVYLPLRNATELPLKPS